jgi:hyperosmotically inducible protein
MFMSKSQNLPPDDTRPTAALLIVAMVTATTVIACVRATPDRVAATPPSEAPRATTPVETHPAEASAPAASPASRSLPGPDMLSDPVITAKIKASLLTDPGMTGADVSVNTDRGVVNLTGNVKSQEQAAIASSHAQRQDGVMRIDNHLAVNTH